MKFSLLSEAAKGISDLPITILSFVFFIILLKRKKRILWPSIFCTLSVVSLLGAIAHIFDFTDIIHNALWTVIYLMMITTILLVHYAFISTSTENRNPTKKHVKILIIFSFFTYLLTMIFLWTAHRSHFDMIVFIIYASLMIFPIILVSLKKTALSKRLRFIIFMLLATVLLQGFKPFQSFSIVVEHAIILLALVSTFSIAINSESTHKKPSE